jgi:hypothetical protein
MGNIEKKVSGRSLGKKILKGTLRVAFHPKGIRDAVGIASRRYGAGVLDSNPLILNLNDISKYMIYASSIFLLYNKLT